MKTSVLIQNGVTTSTVDLIFRPVKLIPWPDQRRAMGDVALPLLKGRHRIAEDVFRATPIRIFGIRCCIPT